MIKPFYSLAVFGNAPPGIVDEIREDLLNRLSELSLKIDIEVQFFVGKPSEYNPDIERCSACICFPIDDRHDENSLVSLMERGLPIIPIATTGKKFSAEFPNMIGQLNGLCLDEVGIKGVVLAMLECASLLPRQRKVFLSYRRDESTDAALQLYASLSGRLFDVFLDTHGIHPGEHFQEVLWQRLCDCDVLLFLDTPKYFESRWTDAEFGRAEWRGIPLLRAAWPSVDLSERAQLATSVELERSDFLPSTKNLTDDAIQKICDAVEDLRTRSVTSRFQQLIATLRNSVRRGRGKIEGVSLRRSLIVTTPSGKRIAVYPSLGVPTSYTLHDATLDRHQPPVAVVYDDAGIDEREWKTHMDWISEYVKGDVRLVSSYKAGWDFSDWK